ncbi:MAG: C25 family cysteine peptidase, partial [Candidatus Electryonea clarkiae]|nr:C25 family cysteine peptidase [Candidatus Electryonea clarkiae]
MKLSKWLFGFSCLFLLTGIASARNLAADQGLPLQVSSRVITPNGMRLSLEIAEPEWKTVGTAKEQVSLADYKLMCGFLEEQGLPLVPVTSRTFRLPPRKSARLKILDVHYETYTDIDYAAYFGGSTPGELGQVKSPVDSWYPGKLAALSNPTNRHDFCVSSLITYPVQVNPARREVRVYDRIDVDIRFEEDNNPDLPDQLPTRISSTFLPWYRQFLDWDENELDEYELYRGGVQVVMRDDEELWESLKPWIEWKLQKGWELNFLTDEDIGAWTPQNIRNELRDRYEEQPFDYVVIVGDADGDFSVPGSYSERNGNNCADYYYQLMDDEDIYQDVIIGRISMRTYSELEDYVAKVLSYERDPYMDDTDWYLQGACLAVYDYHPIDGTSVCEYVRSELFNLGYSDVYYEYSSNGPDGARSRIILRMNVEGINYYNFAGGISDGLSLINIHNLNNANKLFVAMQLGSGTGYWASFQESMPEAFIRAWSNDSPTGAIGAFGTSNNTAHWSYENAFSAGGAYSALRLHLPTLGQMLWGAQHNMYYAFSPYRDHENYCFLKYAEADNLMGDPLVYLWTAIPAELNVDAEETIPLGRNSYSVEVTDSDGNPIGGAWVTLYKVNDNENVIARGESDSNGQAILHFPARHEGEAILTVTAQNFHPEQIDVEIVAPDSRVGFTEITFQDDGEDGTEGNDNGLPDAGETVGLMITARNFGDNNQSNITVTAESDDVWITDIDGEVEFETINAGDDEVGEGLILVEIDPETQDTWLLHLNLEFDSDQGTYYDDFAIKINAPQYLFVQATGTDEMEPGDETTVTIEIINVGGSDASASEGHLTFLHSYGTAIEPDANFEAMETGESASAEFEIRSHPESIPGFAASARLIVTTDDGQVDTAWFSIPLGSRSATDPCGPDNYGYWAFDNADTSYEVSPEYDWIEINPDVDDFDYEGILRIEDIVEDYGEAPALPLPFEVQYYGNTFDTITINNNGWAAFGNQEQFYGTTKNSPIPGPYGPNNMLAIYWDERYLTDNSAVFTYYDEDNNRYIIEWFESLGWGGGNNYGYACTYEIIIYDLIGDHVTRSQDNEILFQYLENGMMHHIGYSRYNPWWTTGILDGTYTDGLQYYYFLDPSPGAVEDEDDYGNGLAILFTTNVEFITGTLEGAVTDSATGEPMPGVYVSTTNNMYTTETDSAGYYLFSEIAMGEYDLQFMSECFIDTVLTQVTVSEGETTFVDIAMKHSELDLNSYEIDRELEPDTEETVEITISNDGNGVLEYSAEIFLDDPRERPDQTTESWNNLHAFDLSPDESRYHGIVFVDRNYFISGSNNLDPTGPNKIYKYDDLGRELLATYDQPVLEEDRTATGMRGLAWDGDYLYGVDDEVIYQMEIQPDTIILADSWEVPTATAHFL